MFRNEVFNGHDGPTAARLLSLHNVAWTLQLMDRMRTAIATSSFDALRREVLAVWA